MHLVGFLQPRITMHGTTNIHFISRCCRLRFCMYLSSLLTVLHAYPTQTPSFLFPVAQQPKLGPGRLIVEVSKSHTHTHTTHTPHHTHTTSHTHTHTTPHTHHTHTHHTTHTQSHTTGKTPLNEWSARRTDLYLHNTQETQETSIHALCVIRTRDSCNQTAADLRVIPQGHRNQLPPSLLRLNNRKQADLYMSAVRSRQWRILIIKKPTRCPISQLYLVKNYTCFLQIYCPPSRVVILYSKQ